MRAVVQRVSKAAVTVEGNVVGKIAKGFLVLLGVEKEDTVNDCQWLVDKIISLRVFEDSTNKMNLALKDVEGSLLVVSQFTLQGDCRKGRRPSFDKAAKSEIAKKMYEDFIEMCRDRGVLTETGQFQADMQVELINNGPVTLLLDSKKKF